jgi:hypothetical protein
MSNKQYLEYDPTVGTIVDSTGTLVYTMPGFSAIQLEDNSTIDDVIKLKNAGFTAEEIIAMKKAGV